MSGNDIEEPLIPTNRYIWIVICAMALLSAAFWIAYKRYSNYLDNERHTQYYFIKYVPEHIKANGTLEFGKTTYDGHHVFCDDTAAVRTLRKRAAVQKADNEKWYNQQKKKLKHSANDYANRSEMEAYTNMYNEEKSVQYYVVRITYTRKFRLDIFESVVKQDNVSDISSYFRQLEMMCDAEPSLGVVGADLAYYEVG